MKGAANLGLEHLESSGDALTPCASHLLIPVLMTHHVLSTFPKC